MKRALCTVFLQLALVWSWACDPPTAEPTNAAPKAETTPHRIVSLAPSTTETLFALGAGDRLVGVTRFCDFPAEAKALPKVGGLTDVDVEIVLSLRPDLVVGVDSKTATGLGRTLKLAQVDALFLPVETFADVQASIRTLAERVGAAERGEALVGAIGAIDETPRPDAPRVLVLFGRDPWIAAGPNTFADEMIRRAGGRNALADLHAPYPTLDSERMSALDVDVVIDTSWGPQTPIPVRDAVTVTRLDPGLIRPGPRLGDAMTAFHAAIRAAAPR